MREFTSKIALKNFVPATDEDKIVMFVYSDHKPRVFYWDDCWIEKRYWTINEAAKFLGVEASVVEQTISEYPDQLKRTHYRMKIRYETIIRLQYILKYKITNLTKLTHVTQDNLSYQII